VWIGACVFVYNPTATLTPPPLHFTGSVDWREPNKFKYRKNEVYIDVFESVNLLMSNKGVVLKVIKFLK
jgi:hypothetical protein